MATTTINSPVFNDYWNVIKNWSDEWKDALIAKVTASMSKSDNKPSRPDIHTCFSGDWENDKPTDVVADELRASRYYDSKDIEW